ncbi:exodeoxyribonuclease VII small subunit [Azospirillum sp. Sh1]|uniref:exodeoxyribonuclease VII small subunit n=1 Tax=Azospirillum sp. Sh1 TaxID=2607285 RepID=UPI0011EE2375|nr:exodeoxyribonuclease VII small subunit [Azospirillum sp. Sh1]KAA0577115.1 exodeoxyribonuclease VII small subunit [Azospirillum sp. Sh1]
MVLPDMPPSASAVPIPPDIAALSFEDALAELERIVRQLEEGRGKLDDAISSYERGTALKRICEMKLREAQAKIDRITVSADGSLGTEPARID